MDPKCLRCGVVMATGEQFCSACGADRDKELEIAAFHGPALAKARGWILALGIIYLVSGLLVTAISNFDPSAFKIFWATTLGLFGAHMGLWWWARTRPFPAALVALVLFLTVQGVNAVLEPESMTQGILVKIFFLVAISNAIKAGLAAQRMRGTRA